MNDDPTAGANPYASTSFGGINMTSMINQLQSPWNNVSAAMGVINSEGTSLNPISLMQMQFALAIYFQDETLMSSIISLQNQMSKSTVQNISR